MKDDQAFLHHIRDALREVRDFVEGTDHEGFLEDRVKRSCRMWWTRSSKLRAFLDRGDYPYAIVGLAGVQIL